MRTALRYLMPLGFAANGFLLVLAYARGAPLSLIATGVGLLACAIAGVWSGRRSAS